MSKPKFFDIHTHLNFPDFDKDRDEVIKRALDAGIWMINVGTDYESSKKAIDIAEKYNEGVYTSVGFHPNDNKKEIFDINKYFDLAKNHKVVSIGECGLDLFRQKKNDLERQKEIFIKQIEMSLELNKPLMIHCRDAHDDLINILTTYYSLHSTRYNGNIHFFSGALEQAQKYFDLGFTISFAGVITFSRDYDEIIKKSALDKIMIETDAPFVAPAPHRGKRNESLYVQEVVKRMAEIRGLSYEEMAKITTENALRLFLRNANL